MFDSNSLPVAPEFVEVLSETAVKTATNYLEAVRAPEHVIALVRLIGELNYYLVECQRSPESLANERADRYDIESIVIESINAIARSGGVFRGPWADSQPRAFEQPLKIKKAG